MRTAYHIHGPEMMKLIFAVLYVSRTMGLIHTVIKRLLFFSFHCNSWHWTDIKWLECILCVCVCLSVCVSAQQTFRPRQRQQFLSNLVQIWNVMKLYDFQNELIILGLQVHNSIMAIVSSFCTLLHSTGNSNSITSKFTWDVYYSAA